MKGAKWKLHRKLVTPAFNSNFLGGFVDIFESAGEILVEKLSEVRDFVNIDIYPYISRCTFDIISGKNYKILSKYIPIFLRSGTGY